MHTEYKKCVSFFFTTFIPQTFIFYKWTGLDWPRIETGGGRL